MSSNEPATKQQILDLISITEHLLEALRCHEEALECHQELIKLLNNKVEDLENRIDLVEKLL